MGAYHLWAEFERETFSKRRGPRFWQISDSAHPRATFEHLLSHSLLRPSSPTKSTNTLFIHSYISDTVPCDSSGRTAQNTPRKRVDNAFLPKSVSEVRRSRDPGTPLQRLVLNQHDPPRRRQRPSHFSLLDGPHQAQECSPCPTV